MARKPKEIESTNMLASIEHTASIPLFNAFLFDSNSPLPLRADQTPRQILEKMCKQPFIADTDTGSVEVTVMEGMLANMVTAGLQGNLGVIKEIYQEIEHNGITKVQHIHQSLPSGVMAVLQQSGISIDNMIDVTPELAHKPNEQDTAKTAIKTNPSGNEIPEEYNWLIEE